MVKFTGVDAGKQYLLGTSLHQPNFGGAVGDMEVDKDNLGDIEVDQDNLGDMEVD